MKINKVAMIGMLTLLIQTPITKAASVYFDSSIFGIKSSTGTQLTNSADNLAAYGYFNDGFTATVANYSSWLSNFHGVTGYNKVATGVQTGGLGYNTISAGITVSPVAGPNNDPDLGTVDYLPTVASAQAGTMIGLTAGFTLPENKSFSLIVWNAATSSAATQAAVLTGTTGWGILTNNFDVEPPFLVDVSASAGVLSAVVGSASVTSGNRFIQLAAIPEPSSASLLALGVAGLVALRARRKS